MGVNPFGSGGGSGVEQHGLLRRILAAIPGRRRRSEADAQSVYEQFARSPDASASGRAWHRENPGVLVDAFHLAVKRNDTPAAVKIQRTLWTHPQGFVPKHSRDIPAMALGMPETSTFRPSYLFVSGVPRSGTTALGSLLGQSSEVAMYIELYRSGYGYCPQMFEPANIERLARAGLIELHDKRRRTLEKSLEARFVGDKRPNFTSSAELTFANFQDKNLKIVHIVRSIGELVASYQKRLDEGSWKKDFKTCVYEANKNNKAILDILKGPDRDRIILVEYDDLWSSTDRIYQLLERIGIQASSIRSSLVERGVSTAQSLRQKDRQITSEQDKFIARNYDRESEEEVRLQARSGFSSG